MSKSLFLKYSQLGQFLMGTYHLDTKTSTCKKALYRCYHYILLAYFFSFLSSQWMEVYTQAKGNDPFKLADSLYISSLYIVTLAKLFINQNHNMESLTKQVEETEEVVMNGNEPEMKAIFAYYIKKNWKTAWAFYFAGFFTLMTLFVSPYIHYRTFKYNCIQNVTFERMWPFAAWFPVDKNVYYPQTYVYLVIAGIVAGGITMINDTILWGFLIFVRLQIKLLQYKLRYFKLHTRKYMEWKSCDEHTAAKVMVKKCAMMFSVIINFCDDLNGSLSIMMLMDFLIRSIQIGLTGLRMVVVKSFGLQMAISIIYLICMLVQMMFFYWNANEITIESAALGMSIWESDWLECPDDIKKMLNFITLRSQRPLIMKIGPFTVMSTATALTILRASYSYVALLRQVYG